MMDATFIYDATPRQPHLRHALPNANGQEEGVVSLSQSNTTERQDSKSSSPDLIPAKTQFDKLQTFMYIYVPKLSYQRSTTTIHKYGYVHKHCTLNGHFRSPASARSRSLLGT